MLHAREDYQRIQDPAHLIPENEPVFIIRGQDLAAPKVLRYYAMIASRCGSSDELIVRVLQHARRMEEWQRTVTRKVADL